MPSIPAEQDELASLPGTAPGGSKSIYELDGGMFVAIRGSGSFAPGSGDVHIPRPSWPSVDDAHAGDSLPVGGRRPQGSEVHDDQGKVPQQRSDPSPLVTPRIPKGVGQSAIPLFPLSLPVFERHNRATLLRMHCLAFPKGN